MSESSFLVAFLSLVGSFVHASRASSTVAPPTPHEVIKLPDNASTVPILLHRPPSRNLVRSPAPVPAHLISFHKHHARKKPSNPLAPAPLHPISFHKYHARKRSSGPASAPSHLFPPPSYQQAILVHRWLPGSRSSKKLVHLCLQGMALAFGIFGIWTKFHGSKGIVANFYSLHSWMGLICVFLFGTQWVMGFLSFWHRGEIRSSRVTVLPWHVFLGLYTYGLAVATAETGLLEKITFLQTKRKVLIHSSESMIVNSLGLSLALLSGIVILAAISPKCQNSKLLHLDGKCITS